MRYDRGQYALQLRHEDSDTGQTVAYAGGGENIIPFPRQTVRRPLTRKERFAQLDDALCRHIAPLLEEFYPGHPWFVAVEHEQGVIKINLPALMKQNYYVIHIYAIQTNPFELREQIKKGCGQILERYKLPRAGYSAADYLQALHDRPIQTLRNDTLLPA